MTLTPEIIKEAYRESNSLAIGADPTSDQSAEALVILNRVVSGAYGYEVGDPLFDWPIGSTGVVARQQWTEIEWRDLLPNVRLVAINDSAQTVYLPPDPEDGARVGIIDPSEILATYPVTIMGNGRQIEDADSVIANVAGESKIWFYRGDLGKWVLLSELTGGVSEEFPFPQEFDDYFITKVAMRLNPRYGRSLSEDSAAALVGTLRKLRSRYRQTQVVPVDLGVLNLTTSRADSGRIVRNRMGWMQ